MPTFSPKVRRLLAGLGALLVIVLAWDVYYFSGGGRTAHRRPAPAPVHLAPPAPPAANPAPAADRYRPMPVSLPAGARNPFLTAGEQFGKFTPRPTETKGNETTPVRLEGIAVAAGLRAALIGGEAVREGEWVGDIQVERIEHDRVVLARGGVRWTVQLPPPGAPAPEVTR